MRQEHRNQSNPTQKKVEPIHPFLRFLSKNQKAIFVAFLLALGMLLTTHHEVVHACAGFLCGPFEQVDSELGSVDGASDLVGRYKVGINFAIVVIISLPTIFGMVRNVGRDEIGWYIAGSFLIFLIMLVLNWLGDWVFGITNGTDTDSAAALFHTFAVLMPGQGLW